MFRPKTPVLTNAAKATSKMRTLADALEPGTLYLVAGLRPCHTSLIPSAAVRAAFKAMCFPRATDSPAPSSAAGDTTALGQPETQHNMDLYLAPDACWSYSLYYHEGQAIDTGVAGTMFALIEMQGDEYVGDGYEMPPRANGIPDCTIDLEDSESDEPTGEDTDKDKDKNKNKTKNDSNHNNMKKKDPDTIVGHAIISTKTLHYEWLVRRLALPPTLITNTVALARLVRVPHCLIIRTHQYLHWVTRSLALTSTPASLSRIDWTFSVAFHVRAHVQISQHLADVAAFKTAEVDEIMAEHTREVVPWVNTAMQSFGVLPRPVMVSAFSVGLRWDAIAAQESVKFHARWTIRARRIALEAVVDSRNARRNEERRARIAALAVRAHRANQRTAPEWRLVREMGLRAAEDEARVADERELARNKTFVLAALAQFAGEVEKRWEAGVEHWERCSHWYAPKGTCSTRTKQWILEKSMFNKMEGANEEKGGE